MPCTTIIVGKNASRSGNTLIARSEDSGAHSFTPKKLTVVSPREQPRHYRSVLSHVEIDLPDNPMQYSAVPNAVEGEGIWAAAGFNTAGVSMTATETITANSRTLGADPLVRLIPAHDNVPEKPGGIGEEDIVVLTLPYVTSAKDAVKRLGMLHETYGTYEKNGIAVQDIDEVWWFETIGGHHWMAKRLPDDCYAVIPNQLSIDDLDLEDAAAGQKENMCSADLRTFVESHHLGFVRDHHINPRDCFGTKTEADHVYNTCRAWFGQRYFNPHAQDWDSKQIDCTPFSDTLPWCRVPETPVSIEDICYLFTSHYQGTIYDPYRRTDVDGVRASLRPIGVNRNNFLSIHEMRSGVPAMLAPLMWISFGSCTYSALVPFYPMVDEAPEYLSCTGKERSTDSIYWTSRIIAAIADPCFHECITDIERYQAGMLTFGYEHVLATDAALAEGGSPADLAEANRKAAEYLRTKTQDVLSKVLYTSSCSMRNGFKRSDG